MSEELITNQNVSIEKLKEMFDSAFLETAIDKEGDLVLQGNYKCFVEVPESKRFVRFASYIIASENASDEAKAAYANRINKELIVVRAYAIEKLFVFDQHIWLEGGVTPKNIVLGYKFFDKVVPEALRMDEGGVFA